MSPEHLLFTPLPWLDAHWQRLVSARREGRLGHALLLVGPAGVGKRAFADLFAAGLMCRSPEADGHPCGACADCMLLRAGSHPDVSRLAPDADSKTGEIKVDAVRELCAEQALTASRGARKVLQIAPAEAMNLFAANSLLKTLEEPVASTLLILVSEDPTRLPATVISRCQRIDMLPPPADVAEDWLRSRIGGDFEVPLLLRLAHGAPLRALALADAQVLAAREQGFREFIAVAKREQDPVSGAEAWQRLDAPLVLEWLSTWISDLIRLGQDAGARYLSNPDKREELASVASTLGAKDLHHYLQRVLKARALLGSQVNRGLLFEGLMVELADLRRRR